MVGEVKRQGIFATAKGVVAAFLGVQSRQRQEEDFAHGSATSYIVIGLVFVVVFILALVGVVSLVVP